MGFEIRSKASPGATDRGGVGGGPPTTAEANHEPAQAWVPSIGEFAMFVAGGSTAVLTAVALWSQPDLLVLRDLLITDPAALAALFSPEQVSGIDVKTRVFAEAIPIVPAILAMLYGTAIASLPDEPEKP